MTDPRIPTGEGDHQTRPLEGVLVLDLGQIYAGPYATFLMTMAGATVIKIEPPGNGENLRGRSGAGGKDYLPFIMLNRNKLGLSLNLKKERGRELLLELVERADVVVENFAPGVLDRLGCGWSVMRERNPRIIYASCTGYGLTGPKRDLPALDLTVQAMSGVISSTGYAEYPPVKAGPAISDFSAGVHLFGGIMAALFERTKTGRGRQVEVSMLEATIPTLSSQMSAWQASGGISPQRTGNRHSSLSEGPWNVYPAKDGYLAIICINDKHFRNFCAAVDRPDLMEDPRFSSRAARRQNMDALDGIVSEWTSARTKVEASDTFNKHDVVNAPVRELDEVMRDEHLHERGSLRWEQHPGWGEIVVADSPIRFSGSTPMDFLNNPSVGEHNREVLCGILDCSEQELGRLREEEVI